MTATVTDEQLPPPPTVGRIVHFYPAGDRNDPDHYAGIVTKVHDDGPIDVCTFGSTSLYFQLRVWHQSTAAIGAGYWVWPPRV